MFTLPESVNGEGGFARDAWVSFFPDEEFNLNYLDEDWAEMYRAEERTAKLSTYFSAIAIIVSCLGLFGLVSYTAEQRTREIGIRKVLGASVPSLFIMLATDFTKLIFAALIIAIPAGVFLMNCWLENYAFHINVSLMTVTLTILGVVLITPINKNIDDQPGECIKERITLILIQSGY